MKQNTRGLLQTTCPSKEHMSIKPPHIHGSQFSERSKWWKGGLWGIDHIERHPHHISIAKRSINGIIQSEGRLNFPRKCFTNFLFSKDSWCNESWQRTSAKFILKTDPLLRCSGSRMVTSGDRYRSPKTLYRFKSEPTRFWLGMYLQHSK